MAPQNPYDKYLENAVSTASKEELTLMLYDGAVKFCNQAIAAVENKDMSKSNEMIIKTENIIREFQLTLDRKYEVSKNFDVMYDYIYRRLIEANISKDVKILEEMRFLLKEMRDTWKEAMAIAKRS